jgi:uncharacterized protein
MKLAVISDIHDNVSNLEKCLVWISKNNIDSIICTGDVTSDDTINYLAENFSGSIHLVKGNADFYNEKLLIRHPNIIFYGKVGRAEFLKKNLGFCHEPYLFEKVAELGKVNLVFYGHTHKPWEEQRGKVRFVNPGTLSGMFQMATFAVYDAENDELVLQIVDRL